MESLSNLYKIYWREIRLYNIYGGVISFYNKADGSLIESFNRE